MILYIILGVVVFGIFYVISMYNKLVKKRTMVEEGWSGIDVQLKKRYDLIPNLVETVKGYAGHEKETLENVIKARNMAISANGVKDQEKAEAGLSSALSGVFALGESYPDLKANQNFIQLQNELSKVEGDLEKARR